MQKIVLKDNTEILQINSVNEMVGQIDTTKNDTRAILCINVNITAQNTLDNLMNIFSDANKDNYSNIKFYELKADGTYELQGSHARYNLFNRISKNRDNTITLEIARNSELEQQMLDTQLALAELGTMVGGTK